MPNSSGASTIITLTGSTAAADNNITLTASDLPVNQFGYFLTSQTQSFIANPTFAQLFNAVCLIDLFRFR